MDKNEPIKEFLRELVRMNNVQGEQIIYMMGIVKTQEQSIKELVEFAHLSQQTQTNLTSQIKSLKDEVAQLSQRSFPFPSVGKSTDDRRGAFKFPTSS